MSKPKEPNYPAPTPLPAPAPIPQPAEISPQTAEKKRARVAAMRYGLLSTMRSGPGGVTGAGPDLSTPFATGQQKKTLGG